MSQRRLPDWFKIKIPYEKTYYTVLNLLKTASLHTVCREAKCPNQSECYSKGTATFLIMGDICTRHCKYCNIKSGIPSPLDPQEPEKIADLIHELGLTYTVITSVTRDDLPDGGASHFVAVINAISQKNTQIQIEVLIPDFQFNTKALLSLINAHPYVINHNIETVNSLFATLRPQGNYQNSLTLLKSVKESDPSILTKSGFMIGFGETETEIQETLKDLKHADVDIITIGQYLCPNKEKIHVQKYYTPLEFEAIREFALNLGFKHVMAGPLVRSSYHANAVSTS